MSFVLLLNDSNYLATISCNWPLNFIASYCIDICWKIFVMASKLACIILVFSFLSVANSIKCYACGSITASCEEGVSAYCDGAGCAKFFAEVAGNIILIEKELYFELFLRVFVLGRKMLMKYCESGSDGCKSGNISTFSGTLCYCSSNYCNQSSRNLRPFPAICFAVAWFTLKLIIWFHNMYVNI